MSTVTAGRRRVEASVPAAATIRRAEGRNEDLEALCREIVADMLDHLGIDSDSFVGRERVRTNLAFLQLLREQHEERGREFRRGLFQNAGNVVVRAGVSMLLLASGYLIGHGISMP